MLVSSEHHNEQLQLTMTPIHPYFCQNFSYIFSSHNRITGAPEHKVLGAPEMFSLRCAPPSCSLAVIVGLPRVLLCHGCDFAGSRDGSTKRCTAMAGTRAKPISYEHNRAGPDLSGPRFRINHLLIREVALRFVQILKNCSTGSLLSRCNLFIKNQRSTVQVSLHA
jgi:hypothetical protein